MQINLISGVYVDGSPDFRQSMPLNYIPTPMDTGISNGYFRPADGLVEFCSAPGVIRGSIKWGNACYQVLGNKLCRVNDGGSLTILGDIGGSGLVTMDYSFDRIGIAAGGRLYYYDGSSVTAVGDADIGAVVDATFIDGYWITTDGEFLVQTELNDPYSVLPTKYGSSEADPDPVVAVLRVVDELVAVNRYSTETFQNSGGTGFAFSRVSTALVMCGAIGTRMVCNVDDSLAMVGGGRGETLQVWIVGAGQRAAISNREVDHILEGYDEGVLSNCLMETRVYRKHSQILIHLPDQTLVYDINASKELGVPVWCRLASGILGESQYRAQHWTWCYNRWLFGDPLSARVGTATDASSNSFGDLVGWEFGTSMLFNDSKNAIVHQIELTTLPGRVPLGANPTVWTSSTTDGETWGQEDPIQGGTQGQRNVRMVWFQQGVIEQYRAQKFRGTSDCHMPIVRLDAEIEALDF